MFRSQTESIFLCPYSCDGFIYVDISAVLRLKHNLMKGSPLPQKLDRLSPRFFWLTRLYLIKTNETSTIHHVIYSCSGFFWRQMFALKIYNICYYLFVSIKIGTEWNQKRWASFTTFEIPSACNFSWFKFSAYKLFIEMKISVPSIPVLHHCLIILI